MLITRFLNSSASFSSVLVATASVGISPGQDEEGTSRKVERCIFNNWDSKDEEGLGLPYNDEGKNVSDVLIENAGVEG